MKSAFEKRAQVKDIKPGVILYEVISITGEKAQMGRKHIITGKPYDHRGLGLFVKGIAVYETWENHTEFSLDDRNVTGRNHYNFHALFLSEADAQAYVDQINNGQLPPADKEESVEMTIRWKQDRANDAIWDSWDRI